MADRDAGPGPGRRPRRNAADLLSGLLFVLVGLAVLYGSWTMPRLANRGIHPLTAPGLVPGVLALALHGLRRPARRRRLARRRDRRRGRGAGRASSAAR